MSQRNELLFFLLIMLFLISPLAITKDNATSTGRAFDLSEITLVTEKISNINSSSSEDCLTDAVSESIHFNSKDSCRKFEGDPFEPGATIISGEDAGKCIDTTNYRPIKILSDSQKRKYGFTPDPNKVVIANFQHLGNFYVAEVPIEKMGDLVFQITNFPSPIPLVSLGHTQIRVKFSSPIKLVPQVSGKGKSQNLNEMLLSIHAVGAQNDYDPVGKGRDGSYSAGMAVFSTHTKVKKQMEEQNRVDQYSLNMTRSQKIAYVMKYLKQSDSSELSDKYDTIANNCGNMQFEIIDSVMDYSDKEKRAMRGLRSRFGVMNPPGAPRSLKARGLIIDRKTNQLPNMDEDPELSSIYEMVK